VEWHEQITLEICRATSKFIRVIRVRDEEGILRPMMVRRSAINESLRLVTMGKFNEVEFKRQFHSIVRVIEGNFMDRKVTLEIDVPPYMNARTTSSR
jgi:hypothetical protein